MRNQKPLAISLLAVMLFMGVGQSLANFGFNLVAPAFSGATSTSLQSKVNNCTNVHLYVTQTGGNFTVNAGAQTLNNNDIAPSARVTSGSAISYPETIGNCGPGQLRQIQFRTDINTLVSVQVSGTWNPG